MKLNTFYLKLVAVAFMLVDHMGHFLVPSTEPVYWAMRILGRLAAPLFWYCFTVGFKHTRDKAEYTKRLGLSAAIMGIGNFFISKLFNCSLSMWQPNIFLTMFLMSLAIDSIETALNTFTSKRAVPVCYMLAILFCLISGLLAEYGWYAVTSILILYFLKGKWRYFVLVFANIVCCAFEGNVIQAFMIFAIPFMLLDSGKKPERSWKIFFYIFYPTHIWLLAIIGRFF